VKRAKLKACIKCKYLVEQKEKVCPVCGSTEFSDKWRGQVIILDLSSEIAKRLNISKEGAYALQIL